ncbi:MAG: lysophospholipid acyltransferase family protein [Cyanobacteria bacterium P01_A01_bin.114]
MSGVRLSLSYRERVPSAGSMVIVSNHRSFLDAPLLMTAAARSVHFACHHYLGQVPVVSKFVESLGCFPLNQPERRSRSFFRQAIEYLQTHRTIGIFPEGTAPMLNTPHPSELGNFHRGFAHLALRAPIEELAILPVAIASHQETSEAAVPLKLLKLFDPSEPLFDQPGWHPAVMYQRVNVLVGRPVWVTSQQRAHYQGRQAGDLVTEVTQTCYDEIATLLKQGCYS